MTASSLFCADNGRHHCYYCGAACSGEHLAKDHVCDTFTNRDIVHFPGSPYVCLGCVESMGAGPDSMQMIDGTIKVRENARGMQPRMYSWILERDRKRAATKAHIAFLRAVVLNPPAPPFAIILADSGQKQLIFRAPVAMSREIFPIMLEDVIIEARPEMLDARLKSARPICAALGKPALLGELGVSAFTRYLDYFGDCDGLEAWLAVRLEPLSRLAAWLSPNKEDSQDEYPGIGNGSLERRGIPATASRTDRPESATPSDGTGGSEERSNQLRLNLADPFQ
jgi:hypothetical protein